MGRPEFVVSDLTSIAVTWMSSKTSKYFVQTWNNRTLVWEATRCTESTIAGACVTESPRATIVDLKPSTTYYFRIYVSKVSVSAPSEPMKTTKLGKWIVRRSQLLFGNASQLQDGLQKTQNRIPNFFLTEISYAKSTLIN